MSLWRFLRAQFDIIFLGFLRRVEVAIAYDQLETRVAQRTRELVTALEFSQEIAAQLDLTLLLHSVADRTRALTQAQASALFLLDEDRTTLLLVASSGEEAATVNLHQPVRCELARQVAGTVQIAVTQPACTTCRFLLTHTPGLCAVAPFQAGEATQGALCIMREENNLFDPDEIRILTLLANSAAIAIANARLVEIARQRAEEAAALTERERLRAELHDDLAQTLGFLNLETDRVQQALATGHGIEAERELEQIKTAIGIAYEQVRAALTGLGEPIPTSGDLFEKLAACLDEFRRANDLAAELIVADPALLMLSAVAQRQVVHVVREALINVRRHAQARRVWVRVEQANGEASFTIEDDGRGFDPSTVEGDSHLGLTIMRVRAERSGGQLVVDSAPGSGTRIIVRFPLDTGQTTQGVGPEEKLERRWL